MLYGNNHEKAAVPMLQGNGDMVIAYLDFARHSLGLSIG
tara:strand:+ start:13381 stop:13497 length:117 start_codon:yes stop_codon:yes gene_type:complete